MDGNKEMSERHRNVCQRSYSLQSEKLELTHVSLLDFCHLTKLIYIYIEN